MKQKTATSTPLTKSEFKKELRKYPTKTDLKTALRNYPTKVELKRELSALETRMDIKMDDMKLQIDDKARGYRDDVLTKMDQVLGQLETIREDQIIANHHAEEMLARINNHEGRITKIEELTSAQ